MGQHNVPQVYIAGVKIIILPTSANFYIIHNLVTSLTSTKNVSQWITNIKILFTSLRLKISRVEPPSSRLKSSFERTRNETEQSTVRLNGLPGCQYTEPRHCPYVRAL